MINFCVMITFYLFSCNEENDKDFAFLTSSADIKQYFNFKLADIEHDTFWIGICIYFIKKISNTVLTDL